MSEKRQAEEELIPAQRYTRIKLASPSPEKSSGSDTESIHSCQGYETEIVRDTSDTSSSPTLNFEYEITNIEEQKGKYYVSDDSDDEDCMRELKPIVNDVQYDSSDVALLGDTSEENSTSPTSNSDVDPGLPRSDYLDFEKCLLCQTEEKDISYPYCSTCFTWKKSFFPSRPRRRQKIVKRCKETLSKSSEDNNSSDFLNKSVVSLKCKDLEQNKILSEASLEDSGVASSELQLSEDTVDAPSQGPSTSSSDSTASSSKRLSLDMCRVCFMKPENGLFVHINGAHVYGCYNCAKKIWFLSGVCPICRRKIFKVAKLYV